MPHRLVRLALVAAVALPGLEVAAKHGVNFSCARHEVAPTWVAPPVVTSEPVDPKAEVAKAEVAKVEPSPAPAPKPPSPRELLHGWLSAHLPKGGAVVEDGPELAVEHTAAKGETIRGIAASYLELTTVYGEGDLVAAIVKTNPKVHFGPLPEGTVVRIPHVLREAPKEGAEARLGWPEGEGGALRGIYVNATMAGQGSFPSMLDKMLARGMNAIVVDTKDVTGFFTYPSKIPLAIENDANKHATVRSFPHFVRYVHGKGLRVIARVACFRDEWLGPRRHDLALQKKGGGAHVGPSKRVDWLDPHNEGVRAYLLAAVDEALAAGADEIQLDYVRYPTEGVWDADFQLKDTGLATSDVITDFVKQVHEHTQKHGVPLSLDVFGVVAWGDPRDVDATGQDLTKLGPHIEALSPMVYPSHFADGFLGYAKPGDHADVVGVGTKRAIEQLKNPKVVVRPWVQAFPWHTSVFGAPYVADQITSAKGSGGVGWLAWNSGGEYGATFGAVPTVKAHAVAKK